MKVDDTVYSDVPTIGARRKTLVAALRDAAPSLIATKRHSRKSRSPHIVFLRPLDAMFD